MRVIAAVLVAAFFMAAPITMAQETSPEPVDPPMLTIKALCGPLEQIAARLAEKYGEAPVAMAPDSTGAWALVVFAAPGGASWTAGLLNAADRRLCLFSGGTGWETRTPPEAEPSSGQEL